MGLEIGLEFFLDGHTVGKGFSENQKRGLDFTLIPCYHFGSGGMNLKVQNP